MDASGAGRHQLETGFPGLDLVRFAAALMIAFYHFTFVGPGRLGAEGAAFAEAFAPAWQITSSLWVAVQVFFVLSGVVIAFSAQGRSAAEFVWRRALRLYPAAIVCATVTVLVWPKADWLGRYVRSITLWPAGPWVSDVYWTMAVEIVFYAMVALALAVGGSRAVSQLGKALVLVSATWWALRIANLARGDLIRPLIDRVGEVDAIFLLSHGCFFGLGMILFERKVRGPSLALNLLASTGFLTCVAAVGSAARGFAVQREDPAVALAVPVLIWLMALGTIVLALRRSRPSRAAPYPRIVRQAGLATYPLYLVHAEVGIALMLLLEPAGVFPALGLATATVLLVVLAILLVERMIQGAVISVLRTAG